LLLHTELIAEVGTNQLSVKESIATQGTLILPLKLDWSSLPHGHAPHDLEHVCSSGKMAMRKRSAVGQHPKDTQARLLTNIV
jgi:hypothetical protein